jgi:hypothetical protein
MRETEDRVTVVNTGGSGSGGVIAGVLVVIAALVVIFFLFGGNFFGGDRTVDVNVDLPQVEAPAVDVAPAD